MPRQKEPAAVLAAKGKTHISKADLEERMDGEVKPCVDGIAPPEYLHADEKKRFIKIAEQLQKLNIMGETDNDTLARYITAQRLYEETVSQMRKHSKTAPEKTDENYHERYSLWLGAEDSLARMLDRYFRQAHTAASALGLTITSRCKLQVPVTEEAPKVNKFARFGDKAAVDK